MPTQFSTTSSTQPGYFRIGFVVLQIPPTDISTNRVTNDDQVATLRSKTPMFVRSGQARWDVTVRWKAVRIVNLDGTYSYDQWNDLRKVVAIFKASPFVEVENDFLRQHFTNIQTHYQTQRMAFALKQLRIDTDQDSTNVINVTLTMSLFNYAPYTKDFGYVGPSGRSTDASKSTSYESFIINWIAENMDHRQNEYSSPPIQFWQEQEEGTLTFKWRKYIYAPFKSSPPPAIKSASPTAVTIVSPSTPSKRVITQRLSTEVQALINNAALRYGLDPAIVEAQCLAESGGNQSAISSSGAIGLFQLLASTARGLRMPDGSRINPHDPVQNVEGGCQYLAQQLRTFGNYPHALGAYNAGPAYIYAYRDGRPQDHGTINPQRIKTPDGLPPDGIPNGNHARIYVNKVLTNAGRANTLTKVPIQSTNKALPPTTTTATGLDVPDKGYLDAVNDCRSSLPEPKDLWKLDHFTEQGAFFYIDESIPLASADATVSGAYDMFPNQLSIVMVNNLPVIPLSAMQYPTYQHVGPTDTMISIGMNSVGGHNTHLSEPSHDGIQALAEMSNQLEEQFHNLRTSVRAVSSIHRMQAVFIQNQVLNLLGIRGVMIRGLNTETVPEASDLVQVSVIGSQYENIFEESTPYSINGVPDAYTSLLKDILKGDELNTVSKEEKDSLQTVRAFGNAWKAKDPVYLLNEILSISSKSSLNYLSKVDTPAANLSPSSRKTLLSALDLKGNLTAASVTGFLPGSTQPFSLSPLQRDTYPGLQKRREELDGTSLPITYADYFVFSQLPQVVNQASVDAIKAFVDKQFAAQRPNFLEEMYVRLFDFELLTNPLFSRQAVSITRSPSFKGRFDNSNTVDGPSSMGINRGHSCYKDLGLYDYKQDPASYLVDYNQVINEQTATTIKEILGASNQTANSVNTLSGTVGSIPVQEGFEFSANGQALPGQGNALVRSMNLPAYSMNTAYPTYKLMLIEEDNTGPFFAFDNFYSYATVLDIEVIKYRDKPDTAIIQITNLAHLLQHRLYDDTAAGKLERQADRFSIDPSGGLVTGGVGAGEATTGGNLASSIIASKTASGQPYQRIPRKNMVEGRGETYNRVPLKFFALQTGSKIQVRLGYSNNPDALYPVFTGQVTNIDGDEILTLTCQSFQLELMNIPGVTVIKNSLFGFNFAVGGAAFGNLSLSNSGDSKSVMTKMLTSPAARHFGYWQIGVQTDPLLKGFGWVNLASDVLGDASNKTLAKVGALLQNYDRSSENILVNSTINIDGTKSPQDKVNAGRRVYDSENPSVALGTALYSIPKQSKLSVWDLVKDISRRYPHYNLMVRDYGFPYGADATLVFAHPLDTYYRRLPLYGEAEKEISNNVSHSALFKQWWSSVGNGKWNAIWDGAIPDFSFTSLAALEQQTVGEPVRQALQEAQEPMTDLAKEGAQQFHDAILYLHQLLTGTLPGGSSNLTAFGAGFYNLAVKVINSGNITSKYFLALDASFQALYREWLNYLHLSDPATNSGRLRPVRQYHLIDHNHIVHNGITVNDNIYNAVKIKDETPLAVNQNLPPQHVRVLDVTDLINDPDKNVLTGINKPLLKSYAQSFLRDEVGKMYQGELVLRGVADIEPFDVILLSDPSTGMVGPVEVDTVIHSFNLENGYITIIKPRLLMIVNESVSLGLVQTLGFAWANASANLQDVGSIFNPLKSDTPLSAKAVEVGLSFLGIAATIGAIAWAPPVGLAVAILGLTAGYGILAYADNRNKDNFFKIMPLSRFGRPWVGGLQGFAISNFAYSLGQKFRWFDAEEITPTIESWNELLHYRADYIPNSLTDGT